jgi:nickel transport protein
MRLKPFNFGRCLFLAVLAALALVLISAPQAQAHKVYVFAWVEGDTVHVDAYFSKSKKAQDSPVEVLNDAGEKLLEGKTDAEGRFSFKAPQKTNLHVVVSAGMGHKNEFLLKADELGEPVDGAGTPAVSSPSPSAPAPVTAPAAASVSAPSTSAGPDEEQLRRIVDEALAKHLAPLTRAVAALKEEDQEPGAVQIIGGLGWIFGIMGLVMYLRSRKGQR